LAGRFFIAGLGQELQCQPVGISAQPVILAEESCSMRRSVSKGPSPRNGIRRTTEHNLPLSTYPVISCERFAGFWPRHFHRNATAKIRSSNTKERGASGSKETTVVSPGPRQPCPTTTRPPARLLISPLRSMMRPGVARSPSRPQRARA
jgi:hypothetical protein